MNILQILSLGFVAQFLTACGSEEVSPGTSRLSPVALVLSYKDFYNEDEFWAGVEGRELVWRGDSGAEQIFEVKSLGLKDLEISESGWFFVKGFDFEGNLLVYGEVRFDFDLYTQNSHDAQDSRLKNIVISLGRQEYYDR